MKEINDWLEQQNIINNKIADSLYVIADEFDKLNSKILQLQNDIADLKADNATIKSKIYTKHELFVLDVGEQIKQMEEKSKQDEIENKKPVKDISDYMKTLDDQLKVRMKNE